MFFVFNIFKFVIYNSFSKCSSVAQVVHRIRECLVRMRRQTHNHAVVAGRISHCRTFIISHIPFSPISNGIVISIKSIVHTVTRQAVAFGILNQVFESRNVLVIGLETSTRLLCAGCILVEPRAGIQHQQFIISIRTRVIGHESLLVGCNFCLRIFL